MIGILLISAVAITFHKNALAQSMYATDYIMTEKDVKARIADFKVEHPKFATIFEQCPL